jgi:cytochrome P450
MSSEAVPVGTTDDERLRNRVFGAGLVRDPYPTYERLRAESPVHEGSLSSAFPEWPELQMMAPDTGHAMATCTHDAAAAVLRDATNFPSEAFYSHLSASIGQSLIAMDEPAHRRMRILVQAAFSKPEMLRWRRDHIEPIVDEYFDRIVGLGACDLQDAIGSTVPVHAIAAALHLPADERDTFFDLGVQMSNPLLPLDQRLRAANALGAYVTPLAADRRARPADDLIGLLVAARIPAEEDLEGVEDRPLTDEELATFVRVLVVAGSATTYRAYGTLLHHLLRDPEQLDEIRDDPTMWPNAIEEAVRIDQPLATLGRIAAADVDVDGVHVSAGTRVEISIGAANHDPSMWDDPERFDIHRARLDRHLAFGFGIHRCLGIHLARTELEVMLERTLRRLPNLRLDPAADEVFISGLGIRVVNHLPVLYDPE